MDSLNPTKKEDTCNGDTCNDVTRNADTAIALRTPPTALATGRERPTDWHKWIRADRLMAAETRHAIDAYIAHLRTTDIPPRYTYVVRQLLLKSGKTAPQLGLDDYATFLRDIAHERTAQDSYLTQIIAALRYHLRITGKGHLALSLALPESIAITPERTPLIPEHQTVLDNCADYFRRMKARRYTAATLASTMSTLRLAIQATGRHPRDWTTDDTTTILADWNRRGVKGQTVNTRVNTLRPVLRHYKNYEKDNPDTPFGDYAPMPTDPAFRQWPNPDQLAAIMRQTDHDPRPWARTAMYLLAFTCYRRTTVTDLRTANADFDSMRITVRTKGGKTVTVPLNKQYLLPVLRTAADSSPDGRFLYRPDGSGILSDSVYHLCRTVTRRATGTAFRPHDLRRGMARWIYYASGKNLIFVRDFLGHDSTATTEKYLGLSAEEMSTQYDDIAAKLILPGVGLPALQSGPLYIPTTDPSNPTDGPSTP